MDMKVRLKRERKRQKARNCFFRQRRKNNIIEKWENFGGIKRQNMKKEEKGEKKKWNIELVTRKQNPFDAFPLAFSHCFPFLSFRNNSNVNNNDAHTNVSPHTITFKQVRLHKCKRDYSSNQGLPLCTSISRNLTLLF